jgi:hypothetical protein
MNEVVQLILAELLKIAQKINVLLDREIQND